MAKLRVVIYDDLEDVYLFEVRYNHKNVNRKDVIKRMECAIKDTWKKIVNEKGIEAVYLLPPTKKTK
jgi:hypothetical protein